ncbi:MAG TPA: protease pro-enzyme activation domain-containing protein, partial [Terracidiphilus sp.]
MKMLTSVLCALSMATVCASMADAAQSGSRTAAPVIAAPIDNTHLVTLKGNVRVDLSAEHDLGPVEDSLPLRLYMVLQRSPAQQAALENLIERQQQPTAPEYHQWITPQEFGERFGVSERDIAAISQWLESRGMHVNGVMNNASFIDFSATARDVRETFGAQLHYFDMEGGKHPALVQDPMIPAALGNVVAGIQGLNKIPAHANHTKSGQASWDSATHRWRKAETGSGPGTKPLYSNPDIDGDFDVTPQDFYTIYNVNPIFNAGTKGATATVAVVEETDIVYGTVNSTTHAATGGDVQTFRTLFGVPGTLNMHVYHGYGTVTCNDPGVDPNGNGEQGEAALDAEWASALAPAANLIFMSCDQSVNNGIISSEAALIDNNIADVMSLSYGHSELTFAAAEYTSQDTLFAQAAAQGQSFIVSSGDAGSDAA